MRFLIPLLFVCAFSFMFAQEDVAEKLSRQGLILYEAGEWERSDDIYQRMLRLELPDWEKSIIAQNHGSLLSALGQWDAAMTVLRTVPVGRDPYPLLLYQIDVNAAITRLNHAWSVSREIQESKNYKDDRYKDAYQGFYDALNRLTSATDSDCDIQKIKGAPDCQPSEKIKNLQRIIKQQMVRLENLHRQYVLKNIELKQGFMYLLTGMLDIWSHIQKHNTLKAPTEWLDHYAQWIQARADLLTELWPGLEKQIKDPTESAFFQSASKGFSTGQAKLKDKQWVEAASQFASSVENLKKLQKLLFGEDNFSQDLQLLLTSYQLVLSEDPLQLSSLEDLQKEQKKLLIRSKDKLKEVLDKSLQQLELSQKKLKEKNGDGARLMLLEALYLLAQGMLPVDRKDPDQVLKSALEAQRQALLYDQLIQSRRIQDKDGSLLLAFAQKRTIELAKGFPAAAYLKQQKLYSEDGQCTRDPWNHVIPLFNDGYEDAQEADGLLQKNHQAIEIQERVVNSWERALSILEQEEKTKEKQNQQQQQKNAKAAGVSPAPTNPEEVIKLLQEMELEDRIPQQKSNAESSGGLPW